MTDVHEYLIALDCQRPAPPTEPFPRDDYRRRVWAPWPWPAGVSDVARHEAGHIVAGWAVRLPFKGARVSDDLQAGIAFMHNEREHLAGDYTRNPEPKPPEVEADTVFHVARLSFHGWPIDEACERYSLMLAAGAQAELLASGITLPPDAELHSHDQDHRQIRALQAACGRRFSVGHVQRAARSVLTANWPLIESLSSELRIHGRVVIETPPPLSSPYL